MKFRKTFFALLVMLLFTCISTASAATISVATVTDELITNGDCSLREAITNINDGGTTYSDCAPTGLYGTSDTINIPAGTYTTTTSRYDIANNVSIVGAGAGTTIINGNSLDRVFVIGAYTVSISGVTITGGNTSANYGGGIFNQGILTVSDSAISGNTSNFEGGGIYTTGATLYVINSTISGNYAPKAGGIFNWLSTVSITNSTISGNTATQGDQAGGIYSHGWLTVTNSTISGNAGGTGGGILIYGTATVTNSTISGNSASVAGGGLANRIGGSPPNSLTITNSTISGNSGGGISIGVTATLSNSIIANQTTGADCAGSITSAGHNLESSTSCGFTGTGDMQNTDPLLGPLQDNGGPTFTHALRAGSPAFNVIPNGVNGCGTTITTDQRGVSRPHPGGGSCDIGALEAECVQPPSDLVSWWAGEDNAQDMAGSNPGMLNGVTFDSGKVGRAFSFNGNGESVSVPASSNWAFGSGDFAIMFWVYGTNFGTQRPLINNRKTPASNSMWAIETYYTGSNIVEFHSGLTIYLIATNPLISSSWNHVAVTRNGGTLSMYINGVLSGTVVGNTTDFAEINDLQIGRDVMNGNDLAGSFSGRMDEIQIFNRGLSAAEIASIFNAGSGGICKACTAPPSGMVAWWKGDGDAVDAISTHHGTLQGGIGFGPGKVGQAFSFDGGDDYVTIPHNDSLNPSSITVDAWIKTPAGPERVVVEKSHDNTGGWVMQVQPDGRAVFGYFNGDQSWTTNSVYSIGTVHDNNWHHVAATLEGAAIKIYIDGALNNTAVYSGTPIANTRNVNIGKWYGGGRFFNGQIDEVEVFNRALSPGEIAAIYNAGCAGKCFTPDTTPLNFSLGSVSGAAPGSSQTTTYTVTGINVAAAISITGGQYATGGCGGTFTDASGTVKNGDVVCVQVTASSSYGGNASADLTIGTETATFSVDTKAPQTLTVSNTGNGSGTVTSDLTGLNCSGNWTCTFGQGDTVTLTATPADAASYFKGWGGHCDINGQVTLGGQPSSCTASFVRYPVWHDGTTAYFTTIFDAYGDGTTAYTIKAHGVELTDSNLNLSGTAAVVLDGGYLEGFNGYSGVLTTITGPLTISAAGSVTLSNIEVK